MSTDSSNAAFFAQRLWCTTGSILAGLGVILGAFGAHGIEEVLKEVHATAGTREIAGLTVPASYKYLQDFRTAAAYQMTHAAAIVLVGLLGRRGKGRIFGHLSAGCFAGGIVLFCGSLYLLAMTGLRWLGAVAPFGGMLFILGWVLLAVAAVMPRSNSTDRNGSRRHRSSVVLPPSMDE